MAHRGYVNLESKLQGTRFMYYKIKVNQYVGLAVILFNIDHCYEGSVRTIFE
jgi:hypothetical protein